MHADLRAPLDDEAIRTRRALLLRDADERDARERERAAHELPVAAVRRRDDAACALRQRLLQRRQALDGDVVADVPLDDGEAQHLHEHGAEAHGGCLRDARRLRLAAAEAAAGVLRGETPTLFRYERPGEPAKSPADCIRGAARQQAGEETEGFQNVIGKHALPPIPSPPAASRAPS